MGRSVKVAISLPDSEFKELETIREEIGISRSELIVRSLRFWKEARQREEQVRQYVEGYERVPEKLRELEAWEKASMASFSSGDW
ncbi:MAG: ribbon-helix-helix protein, CopG family [Thermodesulfobacteriota bacterium]